LNPTSQSSRLIDLRQPTKKPGSRSNGWMKDIRVNIKGISNGIYDIIPDPSNADRMEW